MARTAAATRATFRLSRFVEEVRAFTPIAGRARRVDRLPDGRTSLIYRVRERGRRGDLTVIGPRTRALLKDATGVVHAVVLHFKPGWSAPLLGVPASGTADAFVSLEDVWGAEARDLMGELLHANRVSDVIACIERAFSSRLERCFEPASASIARRAAHLLEGEEARVDGVAARLGVSARHLRRAFAENIGIAPKDFARAVRLQRAVRMAGGSPDWASVASSAGYYDQAHLIAEFRDLVGLTPTAFALRAREENPPIPSFSEASSRA